MGPLPSFYEKVAEFQGQIDSSDKEAKSLVSLFQSELKNVNQRFDSEREKLRKKHGDTAAVKLVDELSGQILASLDLWKKKQEEAVKSEELRSIAEDSFLVIIYGKVKAGKSTLGNFPTPFETYLTNWSFLNAVPT